MHYTPIFLLIFFVISAFPLIAGEKSSRFLFKVSEESIEEIADRFSTTPDTLLGIRALTKNLNGSEDWELKSDTLERGDLLSLKDSPPFKIADLGSEHTLSEASEKLSIPQFELLKLNTFTLAKNRGRQSKFVIPELESFWYINRKKYEWGWQFLGSFFAPLYILSLFFLGFLSTILTKKYLGSVETVVQKGNDEKKEIPYIILEVLNGIHKGKRVKIESTDFTIGRDSGHNHALTLEGEKRVSGKHARIHLKPDGWVLEDLQSKGGTLVDKREIPKNIKISHGLVVELGFEGVRIRMEPFTPEIAKAYGVRSTSEIRRIAKEVGTGEISKKTRIFAFLLVLICTTLLGFGYKTFVLENRISMAEENLLRHEKSMTDMRIEMEGMNSRIQSLEASRKETEVNLKILENKITEVSKKTDQNSLEIRSLRERLDRLPSKLQRFQNRSVEFSGAVKDLNNSVLQKSSKDEIQRKSEIVKEKFESLKIVASELQIDVEEVEKASTRIEVEPEQEKESGVKIVDLMRNLKRSMQGVNPILQTSFHILHRLVDNDIVLTLAPIVKEAGVLGVFGFLL